MKVTLRATRVYATKDQFGPEPRLEAADSPFYVALSTGDSATVTLGPAPEWAFEARRRMLAVGQTAAGMVLGGLQVEPAERPVRILEIMAGLEPTDQQEIESFRYFTTVAVDRAIEVSDASMSSDDTIWWDWRENVEEIQAFERDVKPAIDQMVLALALRVRGTMPGSQLIDRTFFVTDTNAPFAIPHFEIGGVDVHVASPNVLAGANLQQALNTAAAIPVGTSNVPLPAHWYLAARDEEDPWMRFLCSFFALERLLWGTYKTMNQLPQHSQLVQTVRSRDSSLKKDSSKLMFAVIAESHSPTTAVVDAASFKALYDERTQVAHGELASPDNLQTAAVLELLERYLGIILGI